MSECGCDFPGCSGQCHTGETCPCHPAAMSGPKCDDDFFWGDCPDCLTGEDPSNRLRYDRKEPPVSDLRAAQAAFAAWAAEPGNEYWRDFTVVPLAASPAPADPVAAFLDGIPDDGLPDRIGDHYRVVTVCGHCGEVWSKVASPVGVMPRPDLSPDADPARDLEGPDPFAASPVPAGDALADSSREDLLHRIELLTADLTAERSRPVPAGDALREALTLIADMAPAFHATESVRDHADPNDNTGWNVKGIETCGDPLCREAVRLLALAATKEGE